MSLENLQFSMVRKYFNFAIFILYNKQKCNLLHYFVDIDKRLVVVKDRAVVGVLPGGHDVYKIQKIAMLPLSQQHLPDVEFEVCIPES